MTNFFSGTITAVITPFTAENKIDFNALEKIIEAQIAGGVEGILFAGTTGESPTLTAKEREELFGKGMEMVNKRAFTVIGTGTNDTARSIENAKLITKLRPDAQLAVNPYYNKPTQKGLYEHFTALANATDIPIILYNIKGRTGVNIETDTLVKLAAHKNIRAVKEASGDIVQMMDVIRKVPAGFSVLVGDDLLLLPFMACGGHGLVSVVSNIIPKTCSETVRLCLDEEWEEARYDFFKMIDLINAMFIETNPIPVKETMALLGYCQSFMRLPMCNAEPATLDKLKKLIGVIQKMEK